MLHYRKYKNYDEYLKDQIAKVVAPGKEDYIRRKSKRKHKEFLTRFDKFKPFIEDRGRVLCLGARFGEEVQAFRDLRYYAIGVDLYANEKDLVIKADWNDLPFSKGIFHCVYTNSIDHCFNLDTEIKEICRVLSPAGIVIVDLNEGHCKAAPNVEINDKFCNPDRYESMLWNDDNDVISPFLKSGFGPKMVWLEDAWHTYLLERNNGTNVR
jgi:SAM-dependent methyltransferase